LAGPEKKPPKEGASFGMLRCPTPEVARNQALAWLKGVGKADETTLKQFGAIWDKADRPVLDKVADTLALGDEGARKLLAEARDADAPAPLAVPPLLKDSKKPLYFRANLTLAYAKALTGRRVFDEALASFKLIKPEQVVDPSAYFFHKAVAEHALMYKDEADSTIVRLLDDVADAPERYRMLATLMHFDMLSWQDKDLGWVARKMGVIKDRLELNRGGKKTRDIQKEVQLRLEEMVKEMENKKKKGGA
jgi:hypothetical protein